MGLTVEGVGQKDSVYTNAGMIKPETADDMELSSLLSGSGSFKTKADDEVGKLLAEKKEQTNSQKIKAGDMMLDCLPSVLSAGVGYKLSGSPVVLITCLVSNLAAIAIKCIKNKKAAATA